MQAHTNTYKEWALELPVNKTKNQNKEHNATDMKGKLSASNFILLIFILYTNYNIFMYLHFNNNFKYLPKIFNTMTSFYTL